MEHTIPNAEHLIKEMIGMIGDDPSREGLVGTPSRVIKSWTELYAGYSMRPNEILSTVFSEGIEDMTDEIVMCKNITFTSMCEHHILPFTGSVHIGYIPVKKVVGISKLVRLTECFARRLQIQEKMCNQIADAIMEHLEPKGAAVIVDAQHFCMRCRGVKSLTSSMVTSAMRGCFRDQIATRNEFLTLIK